MVWSKRKKIIVFSVILCGSVFFIYAGKKSSFDPPPPSLTEKPIALTVSIETPQQQTLPLQITTNGSIAAWQEAIIGSEAEGLRLAELYVNVGDRVSKGQLLASFVSDIVEAELAQAEAALAEAQANEEEAAANAKRARQLKGTGAMSDIQADQYIAAEKTTRARVSQAKAQVQHQQIRLAKARILAPDRGIISSRSGTVGSVPSPGAELFRLIRQERLEWRAELTAAELSSIRSGMTAVLKTAAGTEIEGTVRAIGPALDPQTRNALVYVDISPTEEQRAGVKAGMFARGRFQVGQTPALTVSQSAVVSRDGFHYLFTVNDTGDVAEIKVELGRLHNNRFEILSGLQPAMRIVSSGASFLNHGERVRISNAPSPLPAEYSPRASEAATQ